MKRTYWLLIILLGLIILNILKIFYINIFSHSLPYGIYMKINGLPCRGQYAASCLSDDIAGYGINRHYLDKGNCKTGTVQVLKMIKGLPGDSYTVHDGYLNLKGFAYRIMDKDSSGRKLDLFYKVKNGIIDKDKYFLLSDFADNSWDSRYWGPVSIQFLLKPIFIFDNVRFI